MTESNVTILLLLSKRFSNLSNLSKAYPIKLDKPLSGILKADVTTKFDMQSVEKSQYQNINNAGTMSLSGFKYADENGKTMTISNALVQFNPSQVNLKQFDATTGKAILVSQVFWKIFMVLCSKIKS